MNMQRIEKYMAEAEQLIYNNQVDDGLALLNSLLYDEPGYAPLHNYLGWAYLYYTQEMTKAELHFTMAIRFDEAYAPPYLHMGTLHLRAARYAEALKFLENGLTKQGAHKVAFYDTMGQAYELMGEFTRAIKTYKTGAMTSVAGFEVDNLMDGIKRCRKKRLAYYFTF